MKLVDSSVLIDLLRGEKEIEQTIADEDEKLCTCFPINCELYRGTKLARRTEEGIEEVKMLLKELVNLEVDAESAKEVAELRSKYPEINTFDLMIAGICLRHKVTLLTQDSDFQKVEELEVEII